MSKETRVGLWGRIAGAALDAGVVGLARLAARREIFAPENFAAREAYGGALEERFGGPGPFEVDRAEREAPAPARRYSIYYPRESTSSARFPIVVFANGTGVLASKYGAILRQVASWGFVAIGNEDAHSGDGASTDATLAHMLDENEREGSPLRDKLDVDRVGVVGHSQGGAGVFNAITSRSLSGRYKAAVAVSPSNERMSRIMRLRYDITKVAIPTLLLAGDTGTFETKIVIPFAELTRMYERLRAPKGMIRKKGRGHVRMLYAAEGYVVAWLRAFLCDDEEAKGAFFGESPEALRNELYSDGRFDCE